MNIISFADVGFSSSLEEKIQDYYHTHGETENVKADNRMTENA